MNGAIPRPEITVVPANEASREDLEAVFGTRGDTSRCQCQHCKIRDMEWRSVPWPGRPEDKTDDSVWSVTRFVTRTGFRRRGVSRALACAAVDFARERGARALEGYPMITEPDVDITWGELHVGSRGAFADAGFTEVIRPTVRRVVMRIDFI